MILYLIILARLSYTVNAGISWLKEQFNPLNRRHVMNAEFLNRILQKRQNFSPPGHLQLEILPISCVLNQNGHVHLVAILEGVHVDAMEFGEILAVLTEELMKFQSKGFELIYTS